MNYKYLLISSCLSIMTNNAFNGFSVAKLAEHATGCGDYITKSWKNMSPEGKFAIGIGAGAFGVCSFLLYRSRAQAPAQQQFTPKQIEILKKGRDRLLRISWQLVNIQEGARQNNEPAISRVQEAPLQHAQQSSADCPHCNRSPCAGKSSQCQYP